MTISDINAEARSLCDADTTSYTAADLLRRVNTGLETLVGKIINADGTWEYDDTNYTDLPVGTGTLVEAQESYSFSSEYLQVQAIKVLDNNSNWNIVQNIDQFNDISGIAIEEYFSATGLPLYYDILGDTIRLYPAPTSTAVTLAGGLKVHFKRTADLFTSAQVTTGTKEPGLPSPYHVLIAYFASIPYCMKFKKDRVAWLEKKWDEGIENMLKFFGPHIVVF